ncbi:hypothetical protein MMC30_000467 [Trapelia coarctata]|nr:hypothetical protein [Trapelia coarctata]
MEEQKFKVIIVGGSIAALSLAHCLDSAGIDYVVLERHHDIAPQVGASVGIMPNGARILDQLGLFDDVESEIEPLDRSFIYYPDGFSFTSAFPSILHEQFGYPVSFLDRQKFLAILYNRLKDKTKVHVKKEVISIEHLKFGVRVKTADGSRYDGDLVVGADGVHSRTRSEMWKHADEDRPGLITSQEKSAMTVEYTCVYGISSAVSDLEIGEQITCFYDGLTILTFHGKKGRVYWFVIKKLDRKYIWPDIPRFSKLDAEELCQSLKSRKIHKSVDFSHIWANYESYSMTPLEENVFDHWHYGRVVCFGDSMHKMTPNFGQGANSCIESAAALTNTLHDIIHVHHVSKPSNAQINTLLGSFNKVRGTRTKALVKQAGFVTRLQARDGLFNILVGRYIAPYAKDLPASMAGKVMVGAEKLDFLPVPERSEKGWPRSIGGRRVSGGEEWQKRAWQAVQAVTLVVLAAGSIRLFNI